MSSNLEWSGVAGRGEGAELVELARGLARKLSSGVARSEELLGETFLACEELRRERPEAFAEAAEQGALESWCLPHVRQALREAGSLEAAAPRPRGGWMRTHIGPDGRDIAGSEDYSGGDGAALATSVLALRKALDRAQGDGNQTLLRNLGWYRQRLEHKSYEAIAEAEGRVIGTVRTGVARARKYVLRIVHELEHAQPAPLTADAPPEIEPLRQLWQDQELEALERELGRTAAEYSNDPHWLNLKALLTAERGDRAAARSLYDRALVVADAAPVRARILNNLANLCDDEGELERARICWMRAHQLAPHAAAPILNLLAAASVSRDYPSCQHFTALLGELLSSGRLRDRERSYTLRRLRENPRLGWLRESEVWRLGPARWLRAEEARPSETVGARTAADRSSREPAATREAEKATRAVARAVRVALLGVALAASSSFGWVHLARAEAGVRGPEVAARSASRAASGSASGFASRFASGLASGFGRGATLEPKARGGDSMGSPTEKGGSRGD